MKKLELIEALHKRLPQVHPKTLSVFLGRAFNQIIFDTFQKDLSSMDLFARTYKNVPIKHDEEQDLYYSDLPASIVKLPIAGDGVLSISGMKATGLSFAPVKSNDPLIFSGLEVGYTPGSPIPFYIMDNRVEYATKLTFGDIDKVRMRLIIAFDEYGMLDDVYIPSGKDELLFETVINIASGTPPQKEVNDNSNKTD